MYTVQYTILSNVDLIFYRSVLYQDLTSAQEQIYLEVVTVIPANGLADLDQEDLEAGLAADQADQGI